ncbi:short-chain fatty acid transporter [Fusibacter paucivorans]|uniref:Short-chain fatty acid transporter n=1 Tax=Fusibacter paucivorans TaxID=76009 RepID=A0ABS5PQT7_9FIRM|nr:TIGR00366 family protein [Fusibacter paucivorans]MBS7527272.1 short-chain fatty acid transporter [Fusibacter paucivorans]
MLWRISKKFNFAAEKIIPDTFVFCILLTFVCMLGSLIVSNFNFSLVISGWRDGIWSMNSFAFQVILMVVVCSASAKSTQVKKLLIRISEIPKSPLSAMVIFLVTIYIASFINWAFGTILTAILATYLASKVKGLHFPMMIVGGYMVMVQSQVITPSISAYALVATPGHFLEDAIGVIPQNLTAFNPMNLLLFAITTIVLCSVVIFTRPPKDEIVELDAKYLEKVQGEDVEDEADDEERSLANSMNKSKLIMLLFGIFGVAAIIHSVMTKGVLGSLNFNGIIFIFMVLNMFLYNTPRRYYLAMKQSASASAEILLQFPFYGGIMGMMQSSGLASAIAMWLVNISSADTFYVFSFWSAALVNIFIPSQGGQWIIQGPILTEAAQTLGAHIPYVLNAFLNGDEMTNLFNPLWAMPALAIVEMKLKDVWGLMFFLLIFWFIVVTLGLYFLPGLFPV